LASIVTTNTPVRSQEVFNFAHRAATQPTGAVHLLATFDESAPVSAAALLKKAREGEKLVGRLVDFVLRPSLENSPNRFARVDTLATAVYLCEN
jgi:hypothetical protein